MSKSINFFRLRTVAPLTAVLALAAAQSAGAASLSFNSTPVSDAVAQIDSKFGVTISLKPGIDPNARVTFSVDNIQGPGARLDAINQLANSLNADFQKVIVVRKSSADVATMSPSMDSDAPVDFKAGSMSVRDAIATVAGVDGAVAKMTENVDGSVQFSGDEMTVRDAAMAISKQSHTLWKTFYSISPRNRNGVAPGGKIIGYTGNGKPIVELPLRSFRVNADPPVVDTTDTANAASANGDPNQPNAGQQGMPAQQMPPNPYFGYYGGNYNPVYSSGWNYNNGGYSPNTVFSGNSGYSGNGISVLPGWPGYGFSGPTVINNGPYVYP